MWISYDRYCPDGANPGQKGISGDRWSPIADLKDEYIQCVRVVRCGSCRVDAMVYMCTEVPVLTAVGANMLCVRYRVGGNNHGKGRNCYNHAVLGNIPGWGGTNQNHAFRKYVCCAASAPPTGTNQWFDASSSGYGPTMKWSEAKDFCIANGFQNLCTAKQYVI